MRNMQDAIQEYFEEALAVALGNIPNGEATVPAVFDNLIRVETFEEAGVLTSNDGIGLRFRGGSEFQLTIVKSR